MASQTDGYWSRSWALLTRDKGWIKPVLVVAAANLVPIVGQFGASGYALEWGRLTAWGVDSSPKQKNVNVSGCIKSGARAFVVSLGFSLVIGMINAVIRAILGEFLGGLLSAVIGVAMAVLITVATLRATIYQSIGAGYEVERIVDMVKRDYHGLLRVGGLTALLFFGIGIAVSAITTIVLIANFGSLYDVLSYGGASTMSDREIALAVLSWLGSIMPTLFVLFYLYSILGTGANLLITTAVALWMRQFDVQRWGESSDPLPTTAPGGDAAAAYGVPTDQTTAGQYGPGQQAAGTSDVSWQSPVAEVPQSYAPQTYEEPQALPMVVPTVQQPQSQPQQAAQPIVTPPPQTFDLTSVAEEAEQLQAASAEAHEEPEEPSSEIPGLAEVLRELDAQRAAENPNHQDNVFTLGEATGAPTPAVEPAPVVPTFSLQDADAIAPEQAPDLAPEPEPRPERSKEQVVSVIDLSGPVPVQEDTPADALPEEPAFEPEAQPVEGEPQDQTERPEDEA